VRIHRGANSIQRAGQPSGTDAGKAECLPGAGWAKRSPGQALAVLEAMKMEHTVAAPRAGGRALLYAAGDQVTEALNCCAVQPRCLNGVDACCFSAFGAFSGQQVATRIAAREPSA